MKTNTSNKIIFIIICYGNNISDRQTKQQGYQDYRPTKSLSIAGLFTLWWKGNSTKTTFNWRPSSFASPVGCSCFADSDIL